MTRCRALCIVAALSVLSVAGCAKQHENIVHVIAEQAPGLKKSARVQFRGVDVGLVKQVYFTPGGVRIDLLIEHTDVPIRTRDTVRIATAGTFGEQVVDIRPGDQAAPLIARGATLPRAQAESTVALPVGVWRSIVKTLGLKADSTAADSAPPRKP